MKFNINKPDYELSPYTGMTREGWIEAGKYLLEGVFSNIDDISCPISVSREEFNITYPHLNANEKVQESERKAEMFEVLARTFFIAAPLIKDNPDIEINTIKLRDYYKSHVLRICSKDDCEYVGSFDYLRELSGISDEYKGFQQTVEAGALVVCLWISKKEIWDTYTKNEKDVIAEFLASYAHETTATQNWRLFNMLIMAFLHMEGYSIDKAVMLDHAQVVLNYYAGDGWYRDGHNFDYYSAWGFNLYAPLWNLWYGYDNEPYIAHKFEENSNKLMETFPNMFDKDGYTFLWGRSGIYRNASTSAFVGNLFLKESKIDYGLARRIMSGALLQFLNRDDFLTNGIPTLGFYKQFYPLVQGYSCAASPYWLAKPFLVLYFEADHPIWTTKENNGIWDTIKTDGVNEIVLNAPALAVTDHLQSGETILRTGKVAKSSKGKNALWSYAKLNYNTKYPWEATPVETNSIESQQYVIVDKTENETLYGNFTFWAGAKKDVLYRRQLFGYASDKLMHYTPTINLADFPITNGIMRVDKLKLFRWQVDITLGSYGFPDNNAEVIIKEHDNAKAIILKGKDSQGQEKQLAMTIYDGWDEIDYVKSNGTNPDSEKSIIVYAKTTRKKKYDGYSQYVLISQVITKESFEEFKEDEIFPIESISYSDSYKTGAYGNIRIKLKNGEDKEVNFDGLEGDLML